MRGVDRARLLRLPRTPRSNRQEGGERPPRPSGPGKLADSDPQTPRAAALGVADALRVLTAPRSVFRRIEDTGAYGWTLAVLLGLVTLIGYAEVKTGLIERVVQRQTEQRKAKVEREQRDLLGRVELRAALEEIDQAGKFTTLTTQILAVAASPVYFLASVLVIASCLYAAVALTGRKPEYHTLVAICVYSEFVELFAYILRLAMMLVYRTVEVDTSLGILATSKTWLWLSAIDPFRIWFWVLLAMGVTTTRQLSRRAAIIACVALCLLAMGARAARAYAPVSL